MYFFLTTSRIKSFHYVRQLEYLIIEEGELDFFKKKTAIKIFVRDPIPRQVFRNGYAPHEDDPDIQIVGYMPDQYVRKIDGLIEKSYNIPETLKRLVLDG